MAQLVRALTFLMAFGLVPAARANQPMTSIPPPLESVAGEPQPTGLTGTVLEWVVVGVCLCITFTAGGYTFLCYLRRRDALQTLSGLEARYRAGLGKSQDFE